MLAAGAAGHGAAALAEKGGAREADLGVLACPFDPDQCRSLRDRPLVRSVALAIRHCSDGARNAHPPVMTQWIPGSSAHSMQEGAMGLLDICNAECINCNLPVQKCFTEYMQGTSKRMDPGQMTSWRQAPISLQVWDEPNMVCGLHFLQPSDAFIAFPHMFLAVNS